MNHIQIVSSKPSSVILNQTMPCEKSESDAQVVPNKLNSKVVVKSNHKIIILANFNNDKFDVLKALQINPS